jgi:hypothetical protein
MSAQRFMKTYKEKLKNLDDMKNKEKSLSSYSTTQYTKFYQDEKSKPDSSKEQKYSNNYFNKPIKRYTEPVSKIASESFNLKVQFKETELKKKGSPDSSNNLKKQNTYFKFENISDKNEFLKLARENIEFDKMSYKQLKLFLESYVKSILKLEDDKISELLYK